MRHMTRRSIAVALVAVAIACGKDPSSRIPTGPGVPTFSTVTINGPDNLAPGQTAQFTVNVALSDGMVKTATNATGIRWTSNNTSRMRIDTNGLATGLNQNGDAVVTAEVTIPNSGGSSRMRGTKEVTVQPAGTYRLIGTVLENDTSAPISNARVGILPSSATVGTDSLGRYRVYAVPPDATIRVSSTGFETLDQSVNLSANSTQDFRLNLSGPRVSLSGNYTLTIEAASNCAPSLPAQLHLRSYDATITQSGPSFSVKLTQPIFKLNSSGFGDHFTGTALGASATFSLRSYWSDYYYYFYFFFGYPDLAERMSDGTIAAVDGLATTTVTAVGGVAGTLTGMLARFDSSFPGNSTPMSRCWASNHKFTLTPR